ncbi:MAG: FmdB family zinc ribbon protein [Chloroflexota bacterium]
MPVYTYECENGHRFEVKQHFSDASLTECITCGAKVHRVIQPVGVVFKGSGFYVNDSRGKQNLATVGTKKDEAKTSESSSNGSDSAAASASTSSSDNGGGGESTSKPAKVEESAKPAVESNKESSKNGSSNGSSRATPKANPQGFV